MGGGLLFWLGKYCKAPNCGVSLGYALLVQSQTLTWLLVAYVFGLVRFDMPPKQITDQYRLMLFYDNEQITGFCHSPHGI